MTVRARRLTGCVIALSFGLATTASAQEPSTSDPPRVWIFDDGVGARDVPWDAYDPRFHYAPRGLVHLGVALRVGALPAGPDPLGAGPFVEAAAFLDTRFRASTAWRFRLAAVVSAQPAGESRGPSGNVAWSSPFGLRLRISPLAVDLGRYAAFRLSGDIGAQWAPYSGGGGSWDFFPAWSGELVGKLMEGRLELGIAAGMQWTSVATSYRWGDYTELEAEAVIGLVASWVLL